VESTLHVGGGSTRADKGEVGLLNSDMMGGRTSGDTHFSSLVATLY
jgi:hypothetical protein